MWALDIINSKSKSENVEKGVWKFFMEDSSNYGFEEREGQQDMALDITEALRDKEHILIEAGVGIGKSFAYIVPILYYNKYFKKPVVIATSTITLQEQLFEDIRKISNLIDYETEVVLAKGMTHFACKRKVFKYFNSIRNKTKEECVILESVNSGIGDRRQIPVNINENIWNKMNVEPYKHNECPYYKDCYFINLRDMMKNTKGIIICNQDLLIVHQQKSTMGQKGLLNDELSIVVIDEAHNLEDKVRSSLIEEWNLEKIERNLNEGRRAIRNSGIDISLAIMILESTFEELFTKLNLQIEQQIEENKAKNEEVEKFFVNIADIKNEVSKLYITLNELNKDLDIFSNYSLSDITVSALEELENLEEFLKALNGEAETRLFWLERRKRHEDVSIYSCPKYINEKIEELFFNDSRIITILTSATMTNNNSDILKERYSYFIRNTNFPAIGGRGFLSPPKESPYLYDKHSIIYYSENLPHPTNERERFIKEGTKMIVKLLEITNGKALILFTSKSDLEQIYMNLTALKLPWKIIKQQEGASQEEVLDKFRKNVNSVLLGTGAFWEGISIEGKELSNLIIFRLPFPVPDPIIEYKYSISSNPLMEVSVPEMIIKLKQGIGRLIRNYSDKGIVSILDSRLGDSFNAEYKDLVWESLPIKRRTSDIRYLEEVYKTLIE